jgi:hypothetical protein
MKESLIKPALKVYKKTRMEVRCNKYHLFLKDPALDTIEESLVMKNCVFPMKPALQIKIVYPSRIPFSQ